MVLAAIDLRTTTTTTKEKKTTTRKGMYFHIFMMTWRASIILQTLVLLS
jgi:hypothetical protein